MSERIARYMARFEGADWKTMIAVAIVVPGLGVPTFLAFCGLRARKAIKKRLAR